MNYILKQLLRHTLTSSVYRVERKSDQALFVAKLVRGEYPTAAALARLRHEHGLLRSFDFAHVVRPHGLEKSGNNIALILDDLGDRSVRTLIEAGPRPLKAVLEVAARVAAAVESVHRHHVIHKDLRPDHFMLRDDDRTVTLIDFGIATRLTVGAPASADSVEGALAYMSPEQTGRINRTIDRRSDLYSLGVTLYELLTGVRPFMSTDAMELVHCHIARTPPTPHEVRPDLPPVVSAIVMKLLAKAPEDRYQDAGGLKADLDRCVAELDATTGRLGFFPLGAADQSDELRIPQRLYGRDGQLDSLHATYERVRQGAVELLLVRGGSGTGKSALVNELNKVLVREGRVIAGKFDQLSRNVPYAPIVQGCRGLVRSVLAQSPERLAILTGKLTETLGRNARLMVELVPELEALIGAQAPLEELGVAETQRRFEATFQKFLQVFAAVDHTLVFFLDDLQWADSASLRLMHLALTDPSTSHLLMIGAYRDAEVGPVHPITLSLAEMRKAGAVIGELEVAPLEFPSVSQLLADTLHAPVDSLERLAEITLRKTHGNPFFVGQFLTSLHRQNMIAFDAETRSWTWDVDAIERAMVTDNVVDFMVGRVLELSPRARQLLECAACFGHEFERNMLCVVTERPVSEVVEDLWQAVQLGLIVPLDGNYRYMVERGDTDAQQALNASYKFLHDRVQQAAYSFVDDAAKQAVHLRIGRLQLVSSGRAPKNEELFRVVDHLNIGAPLITEASERRELAQLNLRAGQRAQAAGAHAAASALFGACLSLLGEQPWATDYELAYPAQLGKAECEFLGGRIDEAFGVLERIDAHARTALDRVAARSLKITLLSSLNRLPDAVACGVETLGLLGVEIPTDPAILGPAIGAKFAAVVEALGGRDPEALIDLPTMHDTEKLATVELLYKLMPSSFQTDHDVMTLMVLTAIQLMLEYGNSPVSTHLYATFGLVYGGATGDRRAGFRFAELGAALSRQLEERGVTVAAGACHFLVGAFCSHWWKPITDSLDHLQRGLKASLQTGDLLHAGYSATVDLRHRYYRGECLDDLRQMAQAVAAMQARNEDAAGVLWANVVDREICRLRNDTMRTGVADSDDRDLVLRIGENHALQATYHVLRAMRLNMLGDGPQALAEVEAAEPLMRFLLGHLTTVEHVFCRALASARVLHSAATDERETLLAAIATDAEVLRSWGEDCAYNHGHRYTLVAAELAAATGKHDSAIDLYDRAITDAAEHGFVHHQALANELCGLFHLRRGRTKLAATYLMDAYGLYLHWGAAAVADALAERHPIIPKTLAAHAAARFASTRIENTTVTNDNIGGGFDLVTAIRTSQALASELVPDRLIERVMRGLVTNAGARRGLLVAVHDDQGRSEHASAKAGTWLSISAEVTIEPDEVRLGLCEDVTTSAQLAATVVQYVARTNEIVVLGDAAADDGFGGDPYLRKTQARSVLCLPMTHQGRLTGILYLENNATTNAFNPRRVQLLQFLAAQATVAMENAKMYDALHAANETLERRVDERTRELGATNAELAASLQVLRVTQERLAISDRMVSVGTLAAGVAHEINNPLAYVTANLDMILEEFQAIATDGPLKELEQMATDAREGAERVRKIVSGMKTFSRADKERRVLVDIHRVIDQAIVLTSNEIRHRARLDMRLDAVPSVLADEARLCQVFINLLMNAAQAIPVGHAQSHTIAIATRTDARGNAIVEVRDTGCGIPPELLGRVFDPFFTTKAVGQGTGLGLSICHGIVAGIGGEITLESELGRGTVFRVVLPPATSTSEDVGAPNAQRAASVAGRASVLIIDDDPLVRVMLQRVLKHHDVTAVGSGAEALRYIESRRHFDVILCDVMMPEMTGMDIYARISRDAPNLIDRVVFITGGVFSAPAKEFLDGLPNERLTKPFDPTALRTMVNKYLRTPSTPRRSKPSTSPSLN